MLPFCEKVVAVPPTTPNDEPSWKFAPIAWQSARAVPFGHSFGVSLNGLNVAKYGSLLTGFVPPFTFGRTSVLPLRAALLLKALRTSALATKAKLWTATSSL